MGIREYVKSWIDSLPDYTPGETIPGCIKLASNENNYGPSPNVVSRIKEEASRVHMYPHRGVEVKKALADYVDVESECIVVGNGSDELMELALKILDGNSLGFYPSFSQYRRYSLIYGAGYSHVDLEDDFSFPLQRFLEAARDFEILFLCTPNNPTGTVIEEKDLREVLGLGKPTIVDEAYFEFHGESMVDLIDEYPNLIVLRTMAKAFGLAGLRAGYAVTSPFLAKSLSKVKSPFNVNMLAEEAILAALDDQEYMRDCVDKILRDRGKIKEKLSERFEVTSSESNFLLFDVSPMSADEFYERMLDEGIIVRRFGSFKGFDGEYCRVTVGTEEENQRLLEALDNI